MNDSTTGDDVKQSHLRYTEEEEHDFYRKLRRKIKEWSETQKGRSYRWTKWILLAPDLFHLLLRLMADPDVPLKEKGKLAAVVAYFISPLDFLPEIFLGPTGFLDDICLTAFALNILINNVDPSIVQKHWAGEEDVLVVIQKILNTADRMVGTGLFRRLKRVLK
jgi:uncharacterized membrane protein YkvA (DUF1232 family)